MSDYRLTYSSMTDDQLLNLALEVEALVPEARDALSVELARRNLGASAVAEYAQHLLRAEQQKPLAQTLNGFGTKIYGKREVAPDNSFLTTKWLVFLWIPLIPLKSLRVRYIGPGGKSTLLPLGWSRRYLVLGESQPNIRQVVYVYLFVAAFVIGARILDSIQAGSLVSCAVLVVWACIPLCVRRWAAYQNSRRHAKQL